MIFTPVARADDGGTQFRATGKVLRSGYDPVLYGNYLLIHGQGERCSYFYSHLRRPAAVRRWDRRS